MKRKVFLLFVISIACFIQSNNAQTIIKGRVADISTNQPLAGATVSEVGTTSQTIADDNGLYVITVSSDTSSLLFTFTGYQPQQVELSGRKQVDIGLLIGDAALGEVVVVGYGSQKKINLTGAVSTVQSKDLVKVPSSNVSEVLIGKAPGLFTKQNSGVPGSDYANLSIRGYDAPLILVDGIETSWTRMDPNEIESISVLKDAAAAVYGARAGNGVVLITTKRGKSGKPTVGYNGSYSTQSPTVAPKFVPSWQWAELLREGELNSSLPFTYSEEDIQKFKEGTDPDYPNSDWYDAAFRPWTPMHSHSLTVNGGSDKVKYFMTAGYIDQASMYRSGDLSFNRYNVRSNIDAQISDRLGISLDLSYRNELRLAPQTDLVDIWTNLKTAVPVHHALLPDPSKGGAYSGFLERSPVAQTIRNMTGFNDNLQRYFTGRLSMNYKIPGITGLVANAALNYAMNYQYTKILDRPFKIYSYNYAASEYQDRGTNGANSLNENFSQYTQIYPMVSLNYNRNLGNHDIKGLLLAEGIDTRNTSLSAGRVDLLSVEIPYLFAGSTENISNNGNAVETGRVSYVGRFNYAYKAKYLLEGTFRYDASHKFAPGSRWGFFPSASAAWRLSEEPFIKDNISWIDNLKIRGSYSRTGNDNVEAFKYLTGYEIRGALTSVYLFGTDVYKRIYSTGLPNPDITWLTMTGYNLGLEGTFKDGLIGFEFDAFYRITDNVFGAPLENYPSTFGATLPQLNINSTSDRGMELSLNHRNKIGGVFYYSLTGSASLARQRYRKWSEPLYEDPDEIRIYKRTGNLTNRWFGYRSDGIFMSQEEIDNYGVDQDQAQNKTLVPGDIKYKDLNGDNIIDWKDQDVIGAASFPDLTYGLNIQMEYKGLSLTLLFQGASLYNYMIADIQRGALNNLANAYDFHYKYRWQPDPNNPGVNINPDAKLPAILGSGVGVNTNNNKVSDFWLKDGTYLRLRNLNINYTIPYNWIKNIGIKDMNVFVAGSNLLTWSRLGFYKKSLDPEATDTQKFYPPVKVISFGLNFKL